MRVAEALDSNHIGAMIGEHHCRERSGREALQIRGF
jgi:hypothetical protein